MYFAKRYYAFALDLWRDDTMQVIAMADFMGNGNPKEIIRHARRELRYLVSSLSDAGLLRQSQILERKSQRRSKRWKAQLLYVQGVDPHSISQLTGLSIRTVMNATVEFRSKEQVAELRKVAGSIAGHKSADMRKSSK
jgi:hypothetical protein